MCIGSGWVGSQKMDPQTTLDRNNMCTINTFLIAILKSAKTAQCIAYEIFHESAYVCFVQIAKQLKKAKSTWER